MHRSKHSSGTATTTAAADLPNGAVHSPDATKPLSSNKVASQVAQYAIHPFVVRDMDCLTKHTPPVGAQYVLVSMRGAVHPPLYFHAGAL